MSTTVMEQQAGTGYELAITRTFDAPRELVWRAWTEPEMAMQWMGPRGFRATHFAAAREQGERWEMTMEGKRPGSDAPVVLQQGGTTLEMRPPELLRYTFAWHNRAAVGLGESEIRENVVTIRLEAKGNKTVVHFHQAPFATEGERDGHTGGWNSALDCLAEFLAEKQPGRGLDENEVASELHVKRFFAASREVVFRAWAEPEMVKEWFGPRGFTNKVHTWELRTGGVIRLDMIAPDGTTYGMGGRFVEVYPPYRFHFITSALDGNGNALFESWNSVILEEADGGTCLTLDVHVISATDAAPQYLKGMREGWKMTFDKLAEFVEKQKEETER